MRRRDFFAAIAAAAAGAPIRAWALQPAIPTIGLVGLTSAHAIEPRLAAFRAGLQEIGFTEGKNVNIAYKFAGGDLSAASALIRELLINHVDVIITAGGPPLAKAAMDATKTVPIVFTTGSDPIADGLVTSLARPEGNATGATFYSAELEVKQYELLREAAPKAKTIAVTALPVKQVDEDVQKLRRVGSSVGVDLIELKIASSGQLDSMLAALVRERVDAVIIDDAISNQNISRVLAFLDLHGIPAVFGIREFTAAGGLMSYGADIDETYHQVGVYAARILEGASPRDLPVVQPTKFDLAINLKTAKTLGLTIPTTLLANADEVIE